MFEMEINQMVLTALAKASWNSRHSQGKQSLIDLSGWSAMIVCGHITNVERA